METTSPTLLERLSKVQTALKAPKGQTNSFGGYKYRNCEDILEAVKPLLADNGLTLTISDELVNIGDRYYIKAHAGVCVSNQTLRASDLVGALGFAREEETKKGMDGSQITGAASSYARKYALNGLFLIDDTKDSDATNDHGKAPIAPKAPVKPVAPITPTEVAQLMPTLDSEQIAALMGTAKLKGYTVKKEAAEFLDGLSMLLFDTPFFTHLPADKFADFKSAVIKSGWKAGEGETIER